MALLNSGVRALTNRLPKVLSPKQHAIIDYATAGSFLVGAALFWNRNKRAALGSLACGLAEASVAMLTDYPGGVFKVMDFPTHGRVDAGMAAGLEAMPSLLGLGASGWFFRAQGLGIATVTGLTDFHQEEAATLGTSRRMREIA